MGSGAGVLIVLKVLNPNQFALIFGQGEILCDAEEPSKRQREICAFPAVNWASTILCSVEINVELRKPMTQAWLLY